MAKNVTTTNSTKTSDVAKMTKKVIYDINKTGRREKRAAALGIKLVDAAPHRPTAMEVAFAKALNK